MSRETTFVGFGLRATMAFGALQTLAPVLIGDVGEKTTGFLAAYAVYSSVALMGISMRRSLVPLLLDRTASLRERTCELLSRVALLGFAAGALIAVLVLVLASGLPILAGPACLRGLFGAATAVRSG